MLETLDSIDWKELHGFFKPSEVPRFIRDLTSRHPLVRRTAISNLYEELWHQGTVCDITIYTVPFLIELLTEPTVEDKSSIVELLSAISFENPFGYTHPAGVFFAKKSTDYQFPDWWRYHKDIDKVRSEIHKGYFVYQQLLLSSDAPYLRGATAYLLGILTDCDDQNINLLKSHFLNERDERVRGVVVLAVGLLADNRPEHTEWLQNIFDREPSLFLKINAAIGLARSIPDRVADSVIDVLLEPIIRPSNIATPFDLYPWYFNSSLSSGILQYWCTMALNRIGSRLPQLLPTLINALDMVSPEGSYEIGYCILNTIFNGEAASSGLTIDRLSPEQRMGLDAIANSKQFWSEYSENCSVLNLDYMLQDFGLPTRPEKFRAFMAGELSLDDCKADSIPF